MSWIRYLIKNPRVTHLIVFFIIILGTLRLVSTEKTGYPTVDFGIITVTTIYPGASAKDVELKVTHKIEEALKPLKNVKELTSASIENLSQINIRLKDHANIEEAESDVQRYVDQIRDLPQTLKEAPIVEKVDNDRYPVVEISITSTDNNYELMRQTADKLESRLLKLENISKINKTSYLKKEIHINADPLKLNEYRISLNQINHAIQNQNYREPSGDLKTPIEKKLIALAELNSIDDIQNVIIRSGFGENRILISDIATVSESHMPQDIITRYNGNRCIQLSVIKQASSDIIDVSNDSIELIKTFQKECPSSIKIDLITDYSIETKSLLTLVKNNALLGFALVLLFLVILLDLKVAFWTALGIPLSILLAFIIIPYFGVTINFISLIAIIIILGMVVDDAIVVSENIFKHREAGESPEKAAIIGTKEVIGPVIATVATTIVAFAPLSFMTGIMGKFMRELPIVVNLVLLASLFECFFILPSHIANSKYKKTHSIRKELTKKLEKTYERWAAITITHYKKTCLAFIGIFILSIFILLTQMKFILFYNPDGLYGIVEYETAVGLSLEETEKKSQDIEQIIQKLPPHELSGYVNTIGLQKSELSTTGINTNHSAVGNVLIFFSQFKDRDRNAQEIVKDLKKNLSTLDGFSKLQTYALSDGPPVGRPVTVTLVSEDTQARNLAKEDIIALLKSTPGVENIEDNEGTGKEQINIQFNREKAAQLGLNIRALSQTIRTIYQGTLSSDVNWNNEEIDLRLSVPNPYKQSLSTLNTIKVQNNAGQFIPLSSVIETKPKTDVLVINHYDNDRSVTIFADIDTAITTSGKVNKKIKQTAALISEKYPNLQVVFGGEEKDTQEAMKSLFIAMIISLVGIYSILVILFNSFSQPFIVMSAIPFAMTGIIFAFFTHNIVFGFTAIIGLIGLTGIVVNNSLIMITFINKKILNEGFSSQAIANACTLRLRPILLTTLTTAAGLFPSAYQFGGDNAFLIPMIMAIAWGLIFASFVTLFLTPSLFVIHHKLSHSSQLYIKLFKKTLKYPKLTGNETSKSTEIS